MGILCIIGAFVGVIFLKEFPLAVGLFLLGMGYFIGEKTMFRKEDEKEEELPKNRKMISNMLNLAGLILIFGNLIMNMVAK
jgi:hypothetical protein